MKLVDRYLLSQFAIPLGYCLMTFSMMFVVVDLFDNLSNFIDAHTPFHQILQYYLFIFPSLMIYIAPISLLLGLLYALWQMTKHNEIMAMRASGVSFIRIMAPIIGVGLCFSLITSFFQESVAPRSTSWAVQFISRQKKNDKQSSRYAFDLPFKNETQHRIWVIRKFDKETYDMEGVKVVQQRENGSDQEVILAEEAKFYDGKWWFFNLSVEKHDHYNHPVGLPVEERVRQMVDWEETPRDFLFEITDPMFLSSRDLWEFKQTHRNMSDKTFARISTDLHSRIAMPWTCLIVVLFGIPCGVHTARKGALTGIVVALLTFFCFYFLMTFGQWLGKNLVLEPWVSAWMPNAIFSLIGLWLLVRTR